MGSSSGVLLVSASTGTGHLRAAEALRDSLRQGDPARVVEHVDLLELAPRWIRTAYGDGYELLATRTPWIWKQVYRRTDSEQGDQARWGPIAQRVLFREFQRLLLARRWDVCVCTHFLPGQLAAGQPGFPPFAMVITDLTLHRYWAQPRVPRYFVASDSLAEALRPRVPRATVQTTGIPVAPRFAAPPTREEARASLGLDARRPVVLVMGGGLGLGVDETAAAVMRARVPELQVLVVCGRNAAAAERLRASGAGGLQVSGYVRDVERYVAAADLVVTKPGGLTTSEVLALGRPLLLTRPIPGQEEGNSRVLCAAGAALSAASPHAVQREVEQVFEGDRLARLAAAARALGRPRAAEAITAAIGAEYEHTAAA